MNQDNDTHETECASCGELYSDARAAAGYTVCLKCGDQAAVDARKHWCVTNMHKSNYMLITNKEDLIGLNNKGGLVRAPTNKTDTH